LISTRPVVDNAACCVLHKAVGILPKAESLYGRFCGPPNQTRRFDTAPTWKSLPPPPTNGRDDVAVDLDRKAIALNDGSRDFHCKIGIRHYPLPPWSVARMGVAPLHESDRARAAPRDGSYKKTKLGNYAIVEQGRAPGGGGGGKRPRRGSAGVEIKPGLPRGTYNIGTRCRRKKSRC